MCTCPLARVHRLIYLFIEMDDDHDQAYWDARRKQLEDEARYPNHPLTDECKEAECGWCAVRDCPNKEMLHYHHDGCPACTEEEQRQATLRVIEWCKQQRTLRVQRVRDAGG